MRFIFLILAFLLSVAPSHAEDKSAEELKGFHHIEAAIKVDRARIRDKKIQKLLRPLDRKVRESVKLLKKEHRRDPRPELLTAIKAIERFARDEKTRWISAYDELAGWSPRELHNRFLRDIELALEAKNKIDLALAAQATSESMNQGPYREGLLASDSAHKWIAEISGPLRRILLIENGIYTVTPDESKTVNRRSLLSMYAASSIPGIYWASIVDIWFPLAHMIITAALGTPLYFSDYAYGHPLTRPFSRPYDRVKKFFRDGKNRKERNYELQQLAKSKLLNAYEILFELYVPVSCAAALNAGATPKLLHSGT